MADNAERMYDLINDLDALIDTSISIIPGRLIVSAKELTRICDALPDAIPDEIADAIIQIIDDEQKQKLAFNQCYNRVLENFTWKKTADTVEKILEN